MTKNEETKIKIEFKERLVFPQLFPMQGDLLSQVTVKEISEMVAVTQKEFTAVKWRAAPQGATWDVEKAKSKAKIVSFTNSAIEFLKGQVDRLDKEKKITQDLLSLCLKIRDAKTKKSKED